MRLDRLAGLCQNKTGPWATHRKLVKNLTASHGNPKSFCAKNIKKQSAFFVQNSLCKFPGLSVK